MANWKELNEVAGDLFESEATVETVHQLTRIADALERQANPVSLTNAEWKKLEDSPAQVTADLAAFAGEASGIDYKAQCEALRAAMEKVRDWVTRELSHLETCGAKGPFANSLILKITAALAAAPAPPAEPMVPLAKYQVLVTQANDIADALAHNYCVATKCPAKSRSSDCDKCAIGRCIYDLQNFVEVASYHSSPKQPSAKPPKPPADAPEQPATAQEPVSVEDRAKWYVQTYCNEKSVDNRVSFGMLGFLAEVMAGVYDASVRAWLKQQEGGGGR